MKSKSLTKSVKSSFGESKYKVEAGAVITAKGVIVTVFGGEEPHVGAVAIAVPRPSLVETNKISSTSSVYTLIGHKDDDIAKPAAGMLARELNEVVVVIVGIHVDDATEEEIKILINNSQKVIEKLLENIKNRKNDI